MKMQKRIFSFIAISMLASSLNPISERQAHIASAFVSTLTGAVVCASHVDEGLPKQALLTVGATGLAGLLSAFVFSHYTPFGRYQRAVREINSAACDKILTSAFSSYEPLRHYLKIRYASQGDLSDCYLILGKNHLTHLFNVLTSAHEMLVYARSESSATPQLIALCKAQEQVAEVLLGNCNVALSLVDADKEEYYRQRKIYDAYLQRKQSERHHNDTWGQKQNHYWGKALQKEDHHRESIGAVIGSKLREIFFKKGWM